MADLYDLKAEERVERVLPAPPEAVVAFLREHTSPNPLKRATFVGQVRPGSFSLLRRVWSRRNIRPRLVGTLEAVPGGTRLVATCALPWWATLLGRGLGIYAALFGLAWLAMGAAITGVPDNPLLIAGALFMALIWLPLTGVFLSGYIVSQAVAERSATPEALAALLDQRWPSPEAVADAVPAHRPTPRPQGVTA
jgi:hypothetical protein